MRIWLGRRGVVQAILENLNTMDTGIEMQEIRKVIDEI